MRHAASYRAARRNRALRSEYKMPWHVFMKGVVKMKLPEIYDVRLDRIWK
jgi:hypothetical protein